MVSHYPARAFIRYDPLPISLTTKHVSPIFLAFSFPFPVRQAYLQRFHLLSPIVSSMALTERMAYYGARTLLPIYIASVEIHQWLRSTNLQKAIILILRAFMQNLFPPFAGSCVDCYGHKKAL
ncbi:hypothetical protein [Pajaroellobacter abortibovis]|nr:hypothetical protein [Pajaroellobacter abortibovis]